MLPPSGGCATRLPEEPYPIVNLPVVIAPIYIRYIESVAVSQINQTGLDNKEKRACKYKGSLFLCLPIRPDSR